MIKFRKGGLVARLLRSVSYFWRDSQGTVALVMGIAAVPLLMAGAVAIDMGQGLRIRSALQSAADAGALASAFFLSEGKSTTERIKIAKVTFSQNISAALLKQLTGNPTVEVTFPDDQVKVTAKATTDHVFYKGLIEELVLGVEAVAQVDDGIPICLLVLNPSKEKALYINGTADLEAEDCAVQVNSANSLAMVQNGAGTAIAEDFCIRGSYSGNNYSPTPRAKCATETDPLEKKFASDWALTNTATCDFTNVPTINSAHDDSVTHLAPGVYCGGLTVKKGTVQLESGGIYVFKDGMLDIHAHGTLQGDDVAVLLTGNSDTRINTQAGASLILSAPSAGKFAGIVIAQSPTSIPSNENLIIGGGTVETNGILYFPKQPLKITGNGEIGTSSAQFAIIADTVSIEGNGLLQIKIGQDYKTAGLPELPETRELIRIVD